MQNSRSSVGVVEEHPLPLEGIRAQLERILSSEVFSRSGRLVRFLRFSVEQALSGNGDSLKEQTIGIEVFDRKSDYDPRIDPIVRVEARRLRSKLRTYYLSGGRGEHLAGTLRDQLRTAIADVRRIVDDLRPAILDDLGLTEALRTRANQFATASGLHVGVDIGPVPPLSAAAEIAILRIAGEALANTRSMSRSKNRAARPRPRGSPRSSMTALATSSPRSTGGSGSPTKR
jgi:hypothetical protein